MYKIIASISLIIRQFYIPNPFEPRTDAWILNIFAEPIMHMVTFSVVGIFYERGSAPALGSLLYLIFYFIHTGLLMLMGYFQWTKIAIIIIAVLYVCTLCIIKHLINKAKYF